MSEVYWLIRAQRQLKASMAGQLANASDDAPFIKLLQKLSGLLAETFPDASTIIVRDRLQGYRQRSDSHVLLAEVVPSSKGAAHGCPDELNCPAAHIVKVARPADLAKELKGWDQCRPLGVISDSIFVPLHAGHPTDKHGNPRTLVYRDAYQMIGAGDVVTLEDAVMTCCLWNTPSTDSLDRVLLEIYGRLGNLFYVQSCVPPPARRLGRQLKRRLGEGLRCWDEKGGDDERWGELRRCRREALGYLSRKRETFIDPCDYLASVLACPQHAPRMLHGCAHGDLHGRNVLIGLVQRQAASPAVFDYEDMRPNNLIGWDFVKLETELKVRALQLVFAGPESQFIEDVHRFEVELAERTEAANNDDHLWAADRSADSPRDRLMWLLLTIRRLAKLHIGTNRLREREWLEEYYFQLASYGVCTGTFDTYLRRHNICAYVSAGVAARRLSRPWSHLDAQIARQAGLADEIAAKAKAEALAFKFRADPCEMSHYPRFAFATNWVRSEKEHLMKAAVKLLDGLKNDYPHILEIEEELALAYLELKQDQLAEQVLQSVNQRYRNLHDETYCRWGRLWKDRGHAAEPCTPESERHFRLALDQYLRGYDLRRDYYPGINVATVRFVLGEADKARELAEQIIEALKDRSEPVWAPATRGEALVLLARHVRAEAAYLSAVADPSCLPHDKLSMRHQLELILLYADDECRTYWTEAKLDEIFGAPPTNAADDKDAPQNPSSKTG